MIKKLPKYIFILLLLLIAQVLVFNHIHWGGWLNVYPYVLFILILPSKINRALLLVIAFLVGILMDLFSDSGGIHAAALTAMAYARWVIMKSTTDVEETNEGFEPNLFYFDRYRYISYALTLILIHHTVLFFLEVFEFNHFYFTLIKIIGSSILTTLLIILMQYIFIKRKE